MERLAGDVGAAAKHREDLDHLPRPASAAGGQSRHEGAADQRLSLLVHGFELALDELLAGLLQLAVTRPRQMTSSPGQTRVAKRTL